MDGLVPPMLQYKDTACGQIEVMLTSPAPKPPVVTPSTPGPVTPAPKKIIKAYQRGIVFPAKKLESQEDIDEYVEQMRKQLTQWLKGCDGIQLK